MSVVPLLPTGEFDPSEWARLTDPLRVVEPSLRQHAAANGCELLSSSVWPELRLRRTRLSVVKEAEISLASARDDAAPGSWVIRAIAYPRWYLFEPPTPRFHRVRVLSGAEAHDPELVIRVLELALEQVR